MRKREGGKRQESYVQRRIDVVSVLNGIGMVGSV